jgi:integrase
VLLGGKVRLITQNQNPMLYARAFVQGKYKVVRSGETELNRAIPFAEQWFYDIQNRIRSGVQLHEPLFSEIVRDFLVDPSIKGAVSKGQHDNYAKKWNVLEPLFRDVRVSGVTLDKLEDVRNTRAAEQNRYGEPITANTIDKDITFIRQILRWGVERKSLAITVPPAPKRKGRFEVVKHGRPTFSLKQWRTVTLAARKRAQDAEKKRAAQERTPTRGRKVDVEKAWELYFFIVFACGGALRTGEAYSLRWKDCSEAVLNTPEQTDEDAIHVLVLGKHSRGEQRENGWVLFGGVDAYHQLRKRREADSPDDKLFRYNHEEGFRELLKSVDLYTDPSSGMTRNTKSLRVTGINLRLLKNPNVSLNDLRKWCRTSIVQIQNFYDQAHPETSAARVAGRSGSPKTQ